MCRERYFLVCPYHVIHATAQKGSDECTKITGLDLLDFCKDLQYHFDKS